MAEIIKNNRYKILTPGGYKDFGGMITSEQECLKFTFDDFTQLTCSKNHPLETFDGRIISACMLKPGMELKSISGKPKTVCSVENAGIRKCFDITDINSDDKLYFTNGVVSHNCFLGSSATLFDPAVLEYNKKIVDSLPEPNVIKIYNNEVKIFEAPQPNHAYVLGVDISDGTGMDNSVIVIFDVTNISDVRQVVSFNSNEIEPSALALLTARLGARYNYALISGERNGVGAGFFDQLVQTYEYDNIVNYKNRDEMALKYGIYSTNNNKTEACLWAKSMMNMSLARPDIIKVNIKEKNVCYEMEYFESKTLAKVITYAASKNRHDDFVMAMIWALFTLKLHIAENYYNVRKTMFTEQGVELPQLILPTETNYTEDYLMKRITGEVTSLRDNDEKQADSSKREMLQDSIYNAVMGLDGGDLSERFD